jgi:hypothetical protein
MFSTSAGSTRGHADCRAREAGEDEEDDDEDEDDDGDDENGNADEAFDDDE